MGLSHDRGKPTMIFSEDSAPILGLAERSSTDGRTTKDHLQKSVEPGGVLGHNRAYLGSVVWFCNQC